MAPTPDELFRRAQALYSQPLSPRTTQEIESLLEPAPDEEREAAARRQAFDAIIALCEYLNRWNGVGKKNLVAVQREITAALRVDENLALAHYARGFVFRTKGDHENALASFEKAVALDPHDPRAIAQAGAERLYLGRPREALAAVEKAIEIGPDSPARGMFCWIGARAHFFDGNFQEAIKWLRQSIETWPDLWYSRAYEVSALALVGDVQQARLKLADFLRQFPDLKSIKQIIKAEKTNPNKNPFVVAGRRKFHDGLAIAGMPHDQPRPTNAGAATGA